MAYYVSNFVLDLIVCSSSGGAPGGGIKKQVAAVVLYLAVILTSGFVKVRKEIELPRPLEPCIRRPMLLSHLLHFILATHRNILCLSHCTHPSCSIGDDIDAFLAYPILHLNRGRKY